MSWANKRRRTVQKLVTFTPDEWERVNSLHKKVNKYTTRYRSFTVFARKMLTDGEIRVIEIRPLTDPEPLAKEIGRIGVNVNQIAHWANATAHITPAQVEEIRASFDRIELRIGYEELMIAVKDKEEFFAEIERRCPQVEIVRRASVSKSR